MYRFIYFFPSLFLRLSLFYFSSASFFLFCVPLSQSIRKQSKKFPVEKFTILSYDMPCMLPHFFLTQNKNINFNANVLSYLNLSHWDNTYFAAYIVKNKTKQNKYTHNSIDLWKLLFFNFSMCMFCICQKRIDTLTIHTLTIPLSIETKVLCQTRANTTEKKKKKKRTLKKKLVWFQFGKKIDFNTGNFYRVGFVHIFPKLMRIFLLLTGRFLLVLFFLLL